MNEVYEREFPLLVERIRACAQDGVYDLDLTPEDCGVLIWGLGMMAQIRAAQQETNAVLGDIVERQKQLMSLSDERIHLLRKACVKSERAVKNLKVEVKELRAARRRFFFDDPSGN